MLLIHDFPLLDFFPQVLVRSHVLVRLARCRRRDRMRLLDAYNTALPLDYEGLGKYIFALAPADGFMKDCAIVLPRPPLHIDRVANV